jgi:FtsP/CotA-like multicopper oxidase with cupredoxin domain
MLGCELLPVLGFLASAAFGAPSQSIHNVDPSLMNRQSSPDYLSTDYYQESSWPTDAKPAAYTFYISRQTVMPDGHKREAIVVTTKDPESADFSEADISIPGPAIQAQWGAWITVVVVNRLKDMGTGIHFHGVRQYHTNDMDGTPAITQCPIAPGEKYTYRWRATQYGTSWYHGHIGVQAWDGIFGPIIIEHPESREANESIPIMLSDWNHEPLEHTIRGTTFGDTFKIDNILINGKNFLEDSPNPSERYQLNFERGKTYRLRLINAAIDTTFLFSIDNHEMEVIAADFVPIEKYPAKTLRITMGQRYDVLVTANQDGSDFWLRAIPLTTCFDPNGEHVHGDNGLALVRYDSKSTKTPDTQPWPSVQEDLLTCYDELPSKLRPALAKNVPADNISTKSVAWSTDVAEFDGQFRNIYTVAIDNNEASRDVFFSDWRYPSKSTSAFSALQHTLIYD